MGRIVEYVTLSSLLNVCAVGWLLCLGKYKKSKLVIFFKKKRKEIELANLNFYYNDMFTIIFSSIWLHSVVLDLKIIAKVSCNKIL
jgi:hypothetical protein